MAQHRHCSLYPFSIFVYRGSVSASAFKNKNKQNKQTKKPKTTTTTTKNTLRKTSKSFCAITK